MIATAFYKGQGFGNQLWVYAATRSIAHKNGYEFGFAQPELFKGKDFLSLDYGVNPNTQSLKKPPLKAPSGFKYYYKEKQVFHPTYGCDITTLDKKLLNVKDDTFIDGYMQNEGYIIQIKEQLCNWLSVAGDFYNGCTISLRGGEYKNVKNLFLAKEYYYNAMKYMMDLDSKMKFRVVTDDIQLAKEYFPNLPITSSGGVKIYCGRWYRSPKSLKIGIDFSAIQNSKYLILSNSSFSWWGAWTNKIVECVIAPKYWAEFNRSSDYWSQGGALTKGWKWLNRDGEIFTWQQCFNELKLN